MRFRKMVKSRHMAFWRHFPLFLARFPSRIARLHLSFQRKKGKEEGNDDFIKVSQSGSISSCPVLELCLSYVIYYYHLLSFTIRVDSRLKSDKPSNSNNSIERGLLSGSKKDFNLFLYSPLFSLLLSIDTCIFL